MLEIWNIAFEYNIEYTITVQRKLCEIVFKSFPIFRILEIWLVVFLVVSMLFGYTTKFHIMIRHFLVEGYMCTIYRCFSTVNSWLFWRDFTACDINATMMFSDSISSCDKYHIYIMWEYFDSMVVYDKESSNRGRKAEIPHSSAVI